jgi:hypothetical protein
MLKHSCKDSGLAASHLLSIHLYFFSVLKPDAVEGNFSARKVFQGETSLDFPADDVKNLFGCQSSFCHPLSPDSLFSGWLNRTRFAFT